jgi:putative addiction module component (TIGR02574 family)
MSAILKSLETLGPMEKLQLVEDLWDSIDEAVIPVMNDELFAELNRRAEWVKQHQGHALSIEQIAGKLDVRL